MAWMSVSPRDHSSKDSVSNAVVSARGVESTMGLGQSGGRLSAVCSTGSPMTLMALTS